MISGHRSPARVRPLQVAVLGGGIAGAAIASELAADGADVELVPGTAIGSTVSNQRWLHSGLLYRSAPIARAMWSGHRESRSRWPAGLSGPDRASFVVRSASRRSALSQRWSSWQLGADGPPVVEDETGFRTPDRVIDYPYVTAQLIAAAQSAGASVRQGRTATSIDIERPGSAQVRLDDNTVLIVDHCIVAAGAWSVGLIRPLGIDLPVLLRRCVVVRFACELVPVLTVWLDARDGLAHSQDLSLTPFRGITIGAEPDGDVVEEPGHLDGLTARSAALIAEYADLMPMAGKSDLVSSGYCVKLEHISVGSRVAIGVLSANIDSLDWPARLTLAFPGKATLAGQLGRMVLADLRASAVHNSHFGLNSEGAGHD